MPTSIKNKAQGVSDRLPERLTSASRRERVRVRSFGGLDMTGGVCGGIAEMYNLSPRCAPSLATKPERERLLKTPPTGEHHTLAVMGADLYMARGSCLYRFSDVLVPGELLRNTMVGGLTNTDKCMATFNGRLLIFPDKMYVDESDGRLHPMELDTGVLEGVHFCGSTITLPDGVHWKDLGFFEGDSVYISNTVAKIPHGYYRLLMLWDSVANVAPAVTFPLPDSNGIYYGYTAPENIVSPVRVQRLVPNMKRMTVVGNRLCGYDGRTIYISGEGSPFSWGPSNSDDSRGPATLQSCSDGDFTACSARGDELVLFKQSAIVRVTGRRADSFVMTEISAPGIPAELGHTLCEMNGDLYYHGFDGAYFYGRNAQKPELLGLVFHGRPTCGCGVAYEEGYYVCVAGNRADGTYASGRYFYNMIHRAWYEDQEEHMVDGIRLGAYMCSVDESGELWLSRTDGKKVGTLADMSGQSTPVRSFVSFVPDYTNYPDGCRPVNLYLRATSSGTCEMRVLMSYADGRRGQDANLPAVVKSERDREDACEICCITENMQNRLLRIPLPPRRCDYAILALEMLGDWVIHEVTLEYEIPKG